MKRPAAYSIETTLEVGDHEIDVTVWFNAFHAPARISGSWENSHPAESELEIIDITHDKLPEGVTKDDLWNACGERVEDRCWDHFFDMRRA